MRLIYTYVPFQVLIGVLLGIVFPTLNTSNYYILGSLVSILLFVLIFLNQRKQRLGRTWLFFGFVVLFGVLSGWMSQYITTDLNRKNHYLFQSKESNALELVLIEKLKSTKKYQRFYAKVNRINKENSVGKVLVELSQKNKQQVEIGQVLVCKNKIIPIDLPASPYHFDYKKYLERRNVYGKIRLKHFFVKGQELGLLMKIQLYRNSIVAKLNSTKMSQETKGLLMAMLLGDRDEISNNTQKAFVDSGVVHLIAISGMHIGVLYFLLGCTFGFLKRFKYGKYLQVLLTLGCLWSFAVFSGLSSSVVRCVTMFSFIVLSQLGNRKALLLEPIISSALILLWIKPNFLFDAGFQLSYTAVISIVVFYPLITKKYKFKSKIIQYFFDVLLVSIIAQLGVLPLSLYYFHQFPFQFLVANFFAVSLLPLVLYGGLIVLLKILYIKTWAFVETYYDTCILFYLDVIRRIALIEELIARDVFFHESYVLAYYLVIFAIWRVLVVFKGASVKWLLASVLLFQGVVLFQKYQSVHEEELMVQNHFFAPTISVKKGNYVTVFGKDSLNVNDQRNLKSLLVKTKINKLENLNNEVFQFKGSYYCIVSKKMNYDNINQKGMILILRNNPKINLERVVKELQPSQVIVEAKNYQNNVVKWKSTCNKLQVPFYDVRKQGAFIF